MRQNMNAPHVRNSQNKRWNSRNMNPRMNSGTNARQCRYKDRCYRYPGFGYSHYEICRFQDECPMGDSCRYVHLRRSTFLDFCRSCGTDQRNKTCN